MDYTLAAGTGPVLYFRRSSRTSRSRPGSVRAGSVRSTAREAPAHRHATAAGRIEADDIKPREPGILPVIATAPGTAPASALGLGRQGLVGALVRRRSLHSGIRAEPGTHERNGPAAVDSAGNSPGR